MTSKTLRPPLFICALLETDILTQALLQILSRDRYVVTELKSEPEFLHFVEQEKQHIDCLVFQANSRLLEQAVSLRQACILLPMLVIQPEIESLLTGGDPTTRRPATSSEVSLLPTLEAQYHQAIVPVPFAQIQQLPRYIDQAIAQFVKLSFAEELQTQESHADLSLATQTQSFLSLQQQRLTEKLKERLGYLGVYYKRNPQNFFRHLSRPDKQELLEKLEAEYREILLSYFSDDETVNSKIDELVFTAFFADVSVSQIVEIHMGLIDSFSKQLKLEGRNEDILLDYRLTLIDVIAHLCEMYRRSIPREA